MKMLSKSDGFWQRYRKYIIFTCTHSKMYPMLHANNVPNFRTLFVFEISGTQKSGNGKNGIIFILFE